MRILITLIVVVSLIGCTRVVPPHWEAAIKQCEKNEGVAYIDMIYSTDGIVDVKCNDGALFISVRVETSHEGE